MSNFNKLKPIYEGLCIGFEVFFRRETYNRLFNDLARNHDISLEDLVCVEGLDCIVGPRRINSIDMIEISIEPYTLGELTEILSKKSKSLEYFEIKGIVYEYGRTTRNVDPASFPFVHVTFSFNKKYKEDLKEELKPFTRRSLVGKLRDMISDVLRRKLLLQVTYRYNGKEAMLEESSGRIDDFLKKTLEFMKQQLAEAIIKRLDNASDRIQSALDLLQSSLPNIILTDTKQLEDNLSYIVNVLAKYRQLVEKVMDEDFQISLLDLLQSGLEISNSNIGLKVNLNIGGLLDDLIERINEETNVGLRVQRKIDDGKLISTFIDIILNTFYLSSPLICLDDTREQHIRPYIAINTRKRRFNRAVEIQGPLFGFIGPLTTIDYFVMTLPVILSNPGLHYLLSVLDRTDEYFVLHRIPAQNTLEIIKYAVNRAAGHNAPCFAYDIGGIRKYAIL